MVQYHKYSLNAAESRIHYLMLNASNTNANTVAKGSFEDSFELSLLVAAVVTRNSKFVENFAKPGDLWRASAAFGTPFNAAVSSGCQIVIDWGLSKVQRMTRPPNSRTVAALMNGLGTSLDRGCKSVAKKILRIGGPHFPSIDASMYKLWLSMAVELADSGLLQAILQLQNRTGPQTLSAAFVKACKKDLHNILPAFFGVKLLQINQPLRLSRDPGDVHGLSPLMASIRNASSDRGCCVSVTALLNVGADPNGLQKPVFYASVSQIPLAEAVKREYWTTVAALLNHDRTELTVRAELNTSTGEWRPMLKEIDDYFRPRRALLQASAWQKLDSDLSSFRRTLVWPDHPWAW